MRIRIHFDNNKMPSEAPSLPTQTEKPHHYMYLKEFRTQQCPLFLQHKCTQHRPYTCFHWHFMNQRRRRPIRKRDGTFNYSPDVYCSKYDETTGLCPEGDECPNLHRTAGDTERRYHLRYYKTGTCVHETDSKGHCTKNGPHCAFAHGAEDMRPPVHDVRELQTMEIQDKTTNNLISAPSSLEKEKILSEDPKWNDTNYVLANYKTEACKRPPRLCRQGYACPQFHNNRDRRRSPKKHKYRSTPCPNVKHGDDWGDPGQCENGDGCAYCHTRTEQQFHPEIYKSTKCNDMVQTGYCPRGPFCAFAHVEQEMNTERELSLSVENSLSAFLTSALPICSSDLNSEPPSIPSLNFTSANSHTVMTKFDLKANSIGGSLGSNHIPIPSFPEPIGKERSLSSASSITSDTSSMSSLTSSTGYPKAPGSEREDSQALKLRQQLQSIDDDITLDVEEKSKRKHNLVLLHNLNVGVSHVSLNSPYTVQSIANSVGLSINSLSSMSALAPSFYPPGDTVESVVGNALQLTIDDFDISSIDRELDRDNDSNSVSSSISTGLSASELFAGRFGTVSVPMSIPHASAAAHVMQRGSVGSLSQSPPSPLNSLTSQLIPLQLNQIQHQQVPVQVLAQQKTDQQMEQVAAAFLSQPNPGKFAAPAYTDMNSMSPRSLGTHSPMYSSPLSNNHGNPVPLSVEIQRVQEELALYKSKLSSWEEGYTQAKNACDAWKKEAEEATRRSKIAEEEKVQTLRHRDEALNQLKQSKQKIDVLIGGPFLRCLRPVQELEHLPLPQLRQLQQTLRLDLDRLDKIVYQHSAMKCLLCQDKLRSVVLMPCNHYVVCESCSHTCLECPYCHTNVIQRSSLMVPM